MKIKTLLAILSLSLFLAFGCASVRQAELTTPDYSISHTFPNATTATVKAAILGACLERGWEVISKTDSLIVASLHHHGKEHVTVEISYTKDHIKISYKSSVNLLYEKKKGTTYIHKSYNRWVNNLKLSINTRLANS